MIERTHDTILNTIKTIKDDLWDPRDDWDPRPEQLLAMKSERTPEISGIDLLNFLGHVPVSTSA
jgi:hypothetical protein